MPLLISEIPIFKKYTFNRLALIIGSILPDIIDKPIFLLGLGNGRLISHNLLFISVCFLIVFFISKRNIEISIPLLVGMGFHLLLDLPDVPLFYPFIAYNFIVLEEPLLYWFNTLFTNPLVISTEIIGIAILIFILINNKLYHTEEVKNYLKGTLDVSNKNEDQLAT